jgi:hypothetical protein
MIFSIKVFQVTNMPDLETLTAIILCTSAIPGISYLFHAPAIRRGLKDANSRNYLNALEFMNRNIKVFKDMEMVGLIRTKEHGPVMHIVCDGAPYFLKLREDNSTLMPSLMYDATVYTPTGFVE